MDEHPGVEANAHASRSLESLTIMTTTTPATQTAQEPRPKSPCSLAGNQTPSMFTGNPAWSMIPGVSPTPSEQTLRDQQQLLLQATGETPQSSRSCFAFAGISSSPSLQNSSAPSSPSPLFTPIPLPKLTSSKGTQTHWPDAPTTEEPAQVEATTPQQSAHLPREETGPSAPQEPQASVPPPQTPERSPTASSQPPSHPPPGASQTFYPTMAAPYGWSPAAQSLFYPPPYVQPVQPQQYWYYYPGVAPGAGLSTPCTQPSPWYSGNAHYLTSPPPPQVYTVEPAYIMPQAGYYQPPPVYYWPAGPPNYYC